MADTPPLLRPIFAPILPPPPRQALQMVNVKKLGDHEFASLRRAVMDVPALQPLGRERFGGE